ncbi:LOW QUALITY PROTEIN: uncharacterized protein LOC124288969 [Haliotis rubra]|uniref:LOW QUALITY PROTEIN: uncharacterized protein LOC124288969 n=1 Tax=Haliotis rubra TaxID=36100 RepID=UPI001EE57BF4|nr:LOW QUALITY PROTEIN: uncharacterized protein LOC124288969 [Haliotis rubra]
MEFLVGRYDLMTVSQDRRSELDTELRRNSDKYEAVLSEDDIVGAFRLLRKGVCRPDFPGESSDQCYFVKDILDKLMDMSKQLVESGKITSLSRIHDFCFDFLHDLIQQGPGTTHMQLWINMLRNKDFAFNDYYQNLSGDKLKNYIRFLTREYRSEEPEPGRSRFRRTLDPGIRALLDGNALSPEAFIEARPEFIELYLYSDLLFLNRPTDVKDAQHRIATLIYHKYKRNVFQGLEDPEVFKHFLKRLEEIICQTHLGGDNWEAVVKKLLDAVRMLLTAVDKAFLFHKVYAEILDFVAAICTMLAETPIHSIVEGVGYFYYHIKDPIIKGNSELFTVMTRKMIDFLTNLEDHSLMRVKFADAAVTEVLVKSMDKTPEHRRLMIDLMKACLRIQQQGTAHAAYRIVREAEKNLKWKEHVDDACEILDLLSKVELYGDDKRKTELGGYYKNCAAYLANQITRDRVVPKMVEKMVEFILTILEKREPKLFEAGSEIADEVEFSGKKHKELIVSTFTRLIPIIDGAKFPLKGEGSRYASRAVVSLAKCGLDALDSKSLDERTFNVILEFLKIVLTGEFIDEDLNRPLTVYYILYCSAVTKFLRLLDDQEKIQRAIPVVREVINMLTHDYEEVAKIAVGQVTLLVSNGSKVMAQFFPQMMDVYLDTENSSLLYPLSTLYPHNPKPLEPHFQTIFELIDTQQRHSILSWLSEIAKKQPHLFTDENIAKLIEEMFEGDDKLQSMYLMIMDPLSKTVPNKMVPHLKTLMEGDINTQCGAMYYLLQVLKNVAIWSKDEAQAEIVMAFLEQQIRGPEDQFSTPSCLSEMRAIGGVYRHILESRKPALQDLRERSTVQTTKDQCTFILDVLEGRSLESLVDEIKDVKDDVEELDTRVTTTEVGVVVVSQEVGQQRKDLTEVKHKVEDQGEKIGQLEETVDDAKAKVEELDGKTLSHAPFWTRDVAKLLNPEGAQDWRLLSSRLGYTNDDIRSWAQMHDPCMAMLNEWYATRKTREATYAVLTALQEMDRLDAAVIVENAMKMAETVVEDEEFEYPEPPEVFISYQWGIQNEVKLLKQHLEKAGFTCWMDIGQMGGGDKLFEKIDKGIRAAKLVICCVTGKYAKSPNCNREVNLSVSLGKPIIPLLMEKLSWPPPGSMGPIFSEYLFIRFFTRPGEETGDIRYWSAAKFQELLMQVNYNNVKPDEQKVEEEYKNWWCPVAEVIKIDKKDVKTMTAASQQKQEEVEAGSASPDVFISYQWGKQKQIQLMYKRLTEMGFTVWMDIYQMGGGDSLFDKIDKGVRGAKVVLSCVTTKYSLSANCRREVSLADALKKPIVPLLLEKMTWPPSGPMSMVFTQLLYINFGKDETVQERWDGENFDELLTKLDYHVPGIIILGNMSKQAEVTSSPETEKTTPANSDKQPKQPTSTKPGTSVDEPTVQLPLQQQLQQKPSTPPQHQETKYQQQPELKPTQRQTVSPQRKPATKQSKSCTLL